MGLEHGNRLHSSRYHFFMNGLERLYPSIHVCRLSNTRPNPNCFVQARTKSHPLCLSTRESYSTSPGTLTLTVLEVDLVDSRVNWPAKCTEITLHWPSIDRSWRRASSNFATFQSRTLLLGNVSTSLILMCGDYTKKGKCSRQMTGGTDSLLGAIRRMSESKP